MEPRAAARGLPRNLAPPREDTLTWQKDLHGEGWGRVDVRQEDYRELYIHLQQWMSTGDLSAGPRDTFAQNQQSGIWTLGRARLHNAVLEEARAATAGLPRDGHAV